MSRPFNPFSLHVGQTSTRLWLASVLIALLGLGGPAARAEESAMPLVTPVPSDQTSGPAIPAPLRPWIPWVLEQGPERQDQRACPIDSRDGRRLCAWPGRARLELDAAGGRFEQDWQLFTEHWVPLPGDAETWPLDVSDGKEPVPVVLQGGRPAVKLAAGRHTLSGRFQWSRRPESLVLPAQTGLVDLVLDGQAQKTPRLEEGGRLWLLEPGPPKDAADGDQVRLEVYRRIEDSLPLQVLTRLEIEVSGRPRELRLGPVTLPGGVSLRVEGDLPSRLETDGTLRLQAKPGRWAVEVASYHAGDLRSLSRAPLGEPWPEREVWAFAAHPELRQTEIQGLSLIDPRQTALPEDWTRLPLYLVGPDDAMKLIVQRRGDADPEPDRLSLRRELWLDFDGSGYSVRDQIQGQLTRGSRLEAGSGLELGQVQVGGTPRLITRLSEEAAPGVEVRQGALALSADGRLESAPSLVPASGWALPMERVDSRLYLPPGWDLLAVSGVDNMPNAWLYRWTLLDLFLVLILVIGIGRLWGWGWGALALLALTLTWQSPGAPRQVWLHLLAAAALLRLLPTAPAQTGLSRLRALASAYWRLSLLALLIIGLPFLVREVRGGLYPHLEGFGWSGAGMGRGGLEYAAPAPAFDEAVQAEPAMVMPSDSTVGQAAENEVDALAGSLAGSRAKLKEAMSRPMSPAPRPPDTLDPNAQVQTGQGIPSWRFDSYELAWTGPVGETEQARLWLLSPAWGLVQALVGSLLVTVLGLRLAGLIRERGREDGRGPARGVGALLLVAGLAALAQPQSALAQDLPSPELLKELRERLVRPPDCLPGCLDLSALVLRAEPDRLSLELTLDAAVALAAPVPGGGGNWTPTELTLDGRPLGLVGRSPGGALMAPIPAGRHQIRLAGPLPQRDVVNLPLPLVPRQLEAAAEGWRLEGVSADGRPGSQLQLVRIREQEQPTSQPLAQDALPPLLLIERRLQIGLDWRVETQVRRLSSPDFAVLLPVPLLPGESVQTPGVQVEAGQVKVALAPGQVETGWSSSLATVSELVLTAPDDARLAESWMLDVSALWHLDAQGIPPVHQRGAAQPLLPSWRPLPGETLKLLFVKPAAVPGPTLTIDQVDYRVEPGRRGSEATLTLGVRSSRGGRHSVRLPDGAEPRRLTVDGRDLPLPSGTKLIELPLTPGAQQMSLAWHSAQALSTGFTPSVPDLGSPAVNLSQTLSLPDDRWVLFVRGPAVGPAVLFWGVLIVLAGIAVGLGRSRLTPLRAHDWLLLGIGLALAQVWVVILVAGWLFALGLRRRLEPQIAAWRFNLTQLGLVVLSIAALVALIGAVQQGLLGDPDMQIVGNGSSGRLLSWYQDRGGPDLPEVWVLSVPMWIYRALMLAWALWLAFRLLDWLRWGWEGLSQPQLWRERVKTPKTTPAEPEKPWRPKG